MEIEDRVRRVVSRPYRAEERYADSDGLEHDPSVLTTDMAENREAHDAEWLEQRRLTDRKICPT